MDKTLLKKIPIVQKCYGKADHEFITNLFGEEYLQSFPDDHTLYEFVIFIPGIRPIILLRIRGGEPLKQRAKSLPEFKEILMSMPEVNFDSILFILTVFRALGKRSPLELINESKKFNPVPELDDLLENTFGYLLYAHQFEQVYSRIPSNTDDEVITVRKEWNKKKPDVLVTMKNTMIKPGLSLYDFICERTIEENHFVWNANFKGAKLLFNYLSKEKTKTLIKS